METVITHDDVTRHFEGAATGIAEMLPENPAGDLARKAADDLVYYSRASLDAAGVPRENMPEA